MNRMKYLLGVVLAAGLLLAACDSTPTPTPLPGPTPTSGGPPTATPGGFPLDELTYEQTGGIDGRREVLTIAADGRAVLTSRDQRVGTTTLPAATIGQLVAQLQAANFFTLEDRYDSGTVADDIYDAITIETTDDRTKTVVAAEAGGQGLTPQPLSALIGQLEEIMVLIRAQGGATPSVPPALPSATRAAPAATPTPVAAPATPTPAATGGAMKYEMTGGIAGLRDELTIAADGTAQFTRRGRPAGSMTLTPDRVNALVAQFAAANFFALEDRYDAGNVSDDIYDTLTFTQDGRTHTVTAAQVSGQGLTPQPLLELIATFKGIVAEMETAATPSAVVALTETPAATATSAVALPAINEGADVALYRVQGGIAGLDTALYVDKRGRLLLYERGAQTATGALTPQELQDLIALFNQSNFFALEGRYAPPAAPSDNMIITVIFNYGGQVKAVQAESGGSPPPEFDAIAARLAEIQAAMQR